MSANAGRHLLTDKDFVDVIDDNDDVVGSAPKHWDETYLAPGTKLKSRRSSARTAPSGSVPSSPGGTGDPVEPAGNASTEDWKAYALAKGAKAEDLVVDGKDLSRDELKERYGAKPDGANGSGSPAAQQA